MFPSLDLLRLRLYTLFFRFHLFRQIRGRHQWELVHTQCCPTLQARRDGNDLVESWVLRQVSIWVKCAAMWTTVLGLSMSEHGTWYPWYPFIVYHNGPLKTCKHSILCIYTYSEYTPFLNHFCCNHDNVLIWRQMILYTVKWSNTIVYSWGKRFLGLGLPSTAPCRKVLLRWAANGVRCEPVEIDWLIG